MSSNSGDFQMGVYADAVKGVNSRYPFDFRSIERKAAETLPDWVYRYVSAAAGDGRTQQANIDAFSHYGIVPRMMVSPPQRDLSIELFGKRLISPIFMCPIGLVGLCAPDFKGDLAAARASAATGVPFTLSTFSQTPMEYVIKEVGTTPMFFQLYLPNDRELAASFIGRAQAAGYSALIVTVDSWQLGFRPADLERGNFPQFRGFCMENYYSDENFTKHLAKPPHEDQAGALAHYGEIFAHPLTWEDLRWNRSQTTLPIAVKGIQHADDARMAIDNGADVLYCTNHGGRQANSRISTLQVLPDVVKAAGSTLGDVRLRGARCHRCHHRVGAGGHRGRDRPAVCLRAVLRRHGEPDSLLEVVFGRIRSDLVDLRIQGHRHPQGRRLRTRAHGWPVIV
jgi:lactate 2-monooxygenase